jgi:putative ABC transport system permease protein
MQKKKLLADKKTEAELIYGQNKPDKNKSDYEDSIAKAMQKLDDAKAKVADMDMTKWYVWDRRDNDNCAGLKSDINFIQEVTKAFPIFFFLVAVLISLTTMTRMVEEDRGLIGTYKSLGYSNFRISLKYIFYAVLACVIGGILGSVIGFVGLPMIIGIIMNTLYILPMYQMPFNPDMDWVISVCFSGVFVCNCFSCFEMLHQRRAELCVLKHPKQEVGFCWNAFLSFGKS